MCVWKGRQGAWFAYEGLDHLLHVVQSATSASFDSMINALGEGARISVIASMEQIRTKLVQVYETKFDFWRHIPWRAMGVYFLVMGGDLTRCKDILRECICEYDAAAMTGRMCTCQRLSKSSDV